jgi:hypothetical protein
MFADMPPSAAAPSCEVTPFKATLFADASKTAKVNLPPGATSRKCTAAGEGWHVMTAPDSGGTEACVLYEFGVDPKTSLFNNKKRTAVAKSLKGGACPKVDYGAQGYPGKDWFFLGDNIPLVNAHKVDERVEADGLAFLRKENKTPTMGDSPVFVHAIAEAAPLDCRKDTKMFPERYAACYKATIYNKAIRSGWSVFVALRKGGEYVLVGSERAAK